MGPIEIGIVCTILLFTLIFLGMPIGVSMGGVAILGIGLITNFEAAFSRLAETALSASADYLIAVIPFFVLMGEFAYVSGLTQEAYSATHKWIGHLPGGLAMATIGGCAAFAAVCGSSIATAITMGAVALPEMREYKYDSRLALGSIAAGGTLGILIPPSMGFVLYGIITEQSIGKLFLAGIFPGILLSVLLIITIYIQAKLNPEMGPRGPKASWLSRLATVKDIWAVLVLFIVVMGGIYGGVMTPTDAAAAGAFSAFIIALVRKRLTKKALIISLMNTIRTTGMIYILIIGAMLIGYFMALSGLSISLADFVTNLPFSPMLILVSILLLFLVLGCLMDAFAMLLIIVPILFPVIVRLGFEPLWFAVLTVIMMEMGFITPPIGMNVFVLKGVATDVSMGTIFRGILPFVVAIAVCVALVVAFPQIALFLPGVMK